MCLKETWQNFEFQDCLKEVETWFRDENTQKSKLLPDFEDMGWVKWCMTNKKQELKVRFTQLLLNYSNTFIWNVENYDFSISSLNIL